MNAIRNNRNPKPAARGDDKTAKAERVATQSKKSQGSGRPSESKRKGDRAQKAMGMGAVLLPPASTAMTGGGAGAASFLGDVGKSISEGVEALTSWAGGHNQPPGGQSPVDNNAIKKLSPAGDEIERGNPPKESSEKKVEVPTGPDEEMRFRRRGAGTSDVQLLGRDGQTIHIGELYETFTPKVPGESLDIETFSSRMDAEMKKWGARPTLQRQGKDVGFIHPFAVSDALFDVRHGRMTGTQFEELFTKQEYWHKVLLLLPRSSAFTSLGVWLGQFEQFAKDEHEDMDATLSGYLEMIPQEKGTAYLDGETKLGRFSLEGMIEGAREYYGNPQWTLFKVENRILNEVGFQRGNFTYSRFNPPQSYWGALGVSKE